MNKKLILLTAILSFGTMCAYSANVNDLPRIQSDGSVMSNNAYQAKQKSFAQNSSKSSNVNTSNTSSSSSQSNSTLDTKTMYYPNANIKSAISKYKGGNYSGCLQELFSLVKKDPSNSMAYYYMAMSYTHLGMKDEAVAAYEKVLSLNPNDYLAEYATKGRDCLTGGPACTTSGQNNGAERDELDNFINSPYGNGLSNELNTEIKKKQLSNIQKTINNKEKLEQRDIEKIRNFDRENNKSSVEENDRIAQVTDEEILSAVKTLKDAGMNITVQPENSYMYQYQDPQLAELSMMLGANNNNNNMMNMMPMLMAQSQQGKNIDPRLMQAMMMNSMINDVTFTNNNNDRY